MSLYILCWCSTSTLHRGAFCQFPFWWIYYYGSNKSTRKENGKLHFGTLYFRLLHTFVFLFKKVTCPKRWEAMRWVILLLTHAGAVIFVQIDAKNFSETCVNCFLKFGRAPGADERMCKCRCVCGRKKWRTGAGQKVRTLKVWSPDMFINVYLNVYQLMIVNYSHFL